MNFSKFEWINAAADSEMPRQAKAVLGLPVLRYLRVHEPNNQWGVPPGVPVMWASKESLAAKLSAGERTVRRGLEAAVEWGWLKPIGARSLDGGVPTEGRYTVIYEAGYGYMTAQEKASNDAQKETPAKMAPVPKLQWCQTDMGTPVKNAAKMADKSSSTKSSKKKSSTPTPSARVVDSLESSRNERAGVCRNASQLSSTDTSDDESDGRRQELTDYLLKVANTHQLQLNPGEVGCVLDACSDAELSTTDTRSYLRERLPRHAERVQSGDISRAQAIRFLQTTKDVREWKQRQSIDVSAPDQTRRSRRRRANERSNAHHDDYLERNPVTSTPAPWKSEAGAKQ